MREAIISDVHGNLPALEAVLADIERLGVERIVCLGDTIGYGPFPAECLRLVMERCQWMLLGNHEYALIHGAEGFNPAAETAMAWTRDQLKAKELLRYIESLRPARLEEGRLYVHGSVKDPLMDYVREADSYLAMRRLIDELKGSFTIFNICFTGHNHRAFLATDVGCLSPHPGVHRFEVAGAKLYACVGAVGQPRDDDPRSCYVLFDGSVVEYRRVAYDIEAVARRIREAGLSDFLAERLFLGQ
jgi:diadenosine tetraphosphatase ApaH/serine/threonine PP2A family protein phosphatase